MAVMSSSAAMSALAAWPLGVKPARLDPPELPRLEHRAAPNQGSACLGFFCPASSGGGVTGAARSGNRARWAYRLLVAARDGHGGAIVVLGEPGIGKTALIEKAITAAEGFQVFQTAGHEGEMELPFAALQQLCAPGLDRLQRLPEPRA